MAKTILTNAGIFLGGTVPRTSFNEINIEATAEVADVTTFGDAQRTYALGGLDIIVGGAGFYETVTDFQMNSNWGAADLPITIVDRTAIGAVAFTGLCSSITYNSAFSLDEAARFAFNARMTSDVFGRGLALHYGTISSSSNGAANLLQDIPLGKKASAVLHVVGISGTSPTLNMIIESDDAAGFATPTTRATFAQITTGSDSEVVLINGPITDTYWRAKWTLGGTSPAFTFMVAIGFCK